MAQAISDHLTDGQIHRYRREQPFPKALVTATHVLVCRHCEEQVNRMVFCSRNVNVAGVRFLITYERDQWGKILLYVRATRDGQKIGFPHTWSWIRNKLDPHEVRGFESLGDSHGLTDEETAETRTRLNKAILQMRNKAIRDGVLTQTGEPI